MSLSVVSTNPISGSVVHPIDEPITITFNIPLNPDTVRIDTFILSKPPYDVVGIEVSYDVVRKTVQIIPENFLLPSTTYRVIIVADAGAGVQGYDGSTISGGNYYITFTTEPDLPSPSGTYVTAVEYFMDTAGADGTGSSASPSDGSFNSEWETFYADIDISALTLGKHTLYIHAEDNWNIWGTLQSIPFLITNTGGSSTAQQDTYLANTQGPAVTSLFVYPSPTSGASTVRLTGISTTRTFFVPSISGDYSSSTSTEYLTIVETTPAHQSSLVPSDQPVIIEFSHALSEDYN